MPMTSLAFEKLDELGRRSGQFSAALRVSLSNPRLVRSRSMVGVSRTSGSITRLELRLCLGFDPVTFATDAPRNFRALTHPAKLAASRQEHPMTWWCVDIELMATLRAKGTSAAPLVRVG